jgi:PAS domain S-box-containing protein
MARIGGGDAISRGRGGPELAVLDELPAFVLVAGADRRILHWSRRLEEVTGYLCGEMIGQPVDPLITGPDAQPLPTRVGSPRLVRWRCLEVPPRASGREARLYALGTDVTDDHEEARATLREERLAAAGRLARGLAHELRNPLNGAMLQLSVLRHRLQRGDGGTGAAVAEAAEAVAHELGRLDRLMDDFLAFVEPGPLDPRPLDAGALCREVLAALGPEAEAAGVITALELGDDGARPALDPHRVRQALLHLCRNALAAMPAGGRLALRTRQSAEALEIDVEDSGAGFPESAPIFDPFFTTKATGTGLGLSIVHRVASDHGGTVTVRKRAGGTCFTLRFPLAGAQARGRGRAPGRPSSSSQRRRPSSFG